MKTKEKYKKALLEIKKITDNEIMYLTDKDNLKLAWKQLDEINDIILKVLK